MNHARMLLVLAIATLAPASLFAADVWTVDRTHSNVLFTVRHFVSNVTGSFNDFSGEVTTDFEDLANASVEIVIRTASIDTGNERRDNHLRSDDFFAAEQYPEIRFVSRSMRRSGENKYSVTGDLTIRDQTRRITIPVSYLGAMTLPNGSRKAGFSAEVVINRRDFGVTWNRMLDGGGAMLSDDVRIKVDLELNEKADEKK